MARQRNSQVDKRVEKGDLAPIAQIDNQRFIAKRQNDLIRARRSFEKASVKLSLFVRDQNCMPLICGSELLPESFPATYRIEAEQLTLDSDSAIATRPEFLELAAQRRAACIELQYARNLTLPKLDMKRFAGQDIGNAASPTGDKTPFELQLGLFAEVPLQRREGIGKIRAANGKLTQIDAKTRFIEDKIRIQLQDFASAVNAAHDRIQQSQTNAELARRSLELGKRAFEAGDIDLIALNIYEASVAAAELQLLDAQFKYVYYRAAYQIGISGAAFSQ